jgi:general stress protein YciG
MAGNRTGGLKVAASNKALHGEDFYKKIGAIGGRNGHTGGFAKDNRTWLQKLLRRPTLAQVAGRKGGAISRKRKTLHD